MKAPWAHQKESKSFFSSRPRGNDFSDPGTGKTRVQIDNYKARFRPGRLLVVCPKTLMYSAWGADIETWAPGMTYTLAYADVRAEAFAMKSDAVIINSDGVKWLAENKSVLKQFDHVILDESTAFKHNSSQRSKALIAIRDRFNYRYAMTGTPTPNSVTELHHPMLFIDDGKRLGDSFYRFRQAVQTPKQIGPMANHLKWEDKPGISNVVDRLIADITIRHAFEDVMKHVPPNTRNTKHFKLSPRALKTYKQMENEAIAILEHDSVTAIHAASMRTKLLQIASGAVYTGGEEGHYAMVDRSRYELITELIEPVKQSVVFFNWRHQRIELAAEFERAGYSFAIIDGTVADRHRDQIVKDFQAGQYKTILLHPRTGAHGLTLTRGTTTIIASPIYEADLLRQAIARVYRGGQTEKTNTILVCATGTVEELVYEKLFDKETRMVDLLSLLQLRN